MKCLSESKRNQSRQNNGLSDTILINSSKINDRNSKICKCGGLWIMSALWILFTKNVIYKYSEVNCKHKIRIFIGSLIDFKKRCRTDLSTFSKLKFKISMTLATYVNGLKWYRILITHNLHLLIMKPSPYNTIMGRCA